MAGYLGCANQESIQVANSISDDADGYVSMHGLRGFDGEDDTDGFPVDFKADAHVGTDSILVRRASNTAEMDVKSHVPQSAVIHLWAGHSYAKGTTLMIADASCRNVGLFQVSGPNGLPANHINHNTGAGTNNCTKLIKGSFDCTDCAANPKSCKATAAGGYGPGSKIMEFVAHAYYIGDSAVVTGMPALKRRALKNSGAPATQEEEIAVGVEDLEILYGTDGDGDGSVDQYRSASDMDLNGDGSITDDEWDQVSSVKLSLVFRSQNPVFSKNEKRTYAGKEYDDRYMRQIVNSTVKIRNRG
jgi:type IV pilus assembly protein PilW